MMRTLLPLTFLAMLMTAAPAALAQETTDPPQDGGDAWVKDCPPDMMCAYGGGSAPPCEDADCAASDDGRTYEDEQPAGTGDRPTYDGNCGAEVCAYGGEGCIECSGPVDDGSTCMDGAQGNETCRDDVQYFGGREGCEYCRGTDADGAPAEADTISAPADAGVHGDRVEDGAKQVPGAALVGTLAVLGLAGLALRRRA